MRTESSSACANCCRRIDSLSMELELAPSQWMVTLYSDGCISCLSLAISCQTGCSDPAGAYNSIHVRRDAHTSGEHDHRGQRREDSIPHLMIKRGNHGHIDQDHISQKNTESAMAPRDQEAISVGVADMPVECLCSTNAYTGR